MLDVEEYLRKGGDKELLYLAKIGVEHVPIAKKLLGKGILKKV